MEVIVNSKTNLTVKDQNGNILYQWLPQQEITTVQSKPMSDEDKKYIYGKIGNKHLMTMHRTEEIHPNDSIMQSIQNYYEKG